MVTLDATGSSDPLDADLSYAWTQVDGPDVTLESDDTATPSPFFSALEDPDVRYIHQPGRRLSIGEKRNLLAEHATSDVLVHFDDDDYYGPEYCQRMIGFLEHADVVKLSGFFLYAQAHGVFAYWDTGSVDRAHVRLETGKPPRMIDMTQLAPSAQEKWRIQNLLGFGYTLVYRRAVWEACPFEPVFHGEDLQFTLAADDAGFHVRLGPDEEGISLCRRHADDHTIVFPQCLVPPFVIHRLFGRDALLLVSPDHTNT